VSAGKVYQPNVSQVNVKISTQEINLVEPKYKHQIKFPSTEASTSDPEVKLEI
jgi:hypothetical protein